MAIKPNASSGGVTLPDLQAEASTPAEVEASVNAVLAAAGLPTLAQLQAEAASPAEVASQIDARLVAYGAAKTSDLATAGAIAGEVRQFIGSTPAGWTRIIGASLTATGLGSYPFGAIPDHSINDQWTIRPAIWTYNSFLYLAASTQVMKYSFSSKVWTSEKSGLAASCFVGIDNKVYVIGGSTSAAVSVWNIDSLATTTLASYPENVQFCAGIKMADGNIFCAGGASSAKCRIYNVSANTWDSTIPDLPSSAMAHPILALCGNGKILHVSGTSAWLYDPVAKTWAAAATSPTNTTNCGVAVGLPDGRVILTQQNGGTFAYNYATNTWGSLIVTVPVGGSSWPRGAGLINEAEIVYTQIGGSHSYTDTKIVPILETHWARKN